MDNSAAATAVIMMTTVLLLLFPSFPSSQTNAADLVVTLLPGRPTAVWPLLLSSPPLVATVAAVVVAVTVTVAVAVVAMKAVAVVVVVVRPMISRVGVVEATAVKAVSSSYPSSLTTSSLRT